MGRSRKGMCSPESGKEEARETRVWASEGSPAGARRWGWGMEHSCILPGLLLKREGTWVEGTAASSWAGRRPRRWHHGHVQLCEVHSGQELTALPALSREAACFPFGTFPINRLLEGWLPQLSTVATCLDKGLTSLDFKISPNKSNFWYANK